MSMIITETPKNRLIIQRAPDLMRKELPEIKWAVPDLLPEGLTILASKPKAGKSFLMLNIAFAVAAGGRALGSIEVDGEADVLYLALEDGERRMQDRLKKMTYVDDGWTPARLSFAYHCPPLDDGGLALIDDWLTENQQARLVVIDTFAKVRQKQFGNANIYTQDYKHVSPLKELADKHHVAIVLVHHARKMAAEDDVDAISGSLGLAGAADAVARLKRDSHRQSATLTVTGRDVADVELPLSFDDANFVWTIVGDRQPEPQVHQERLRILTFLEENGPSKPADIAKGIGKESAAVRQTVSRMHRAEQLAKRDDGCYEPYPCNACHTVTPVTPNDRDTVTGATPMTPVTPVTPVTDVTGNTTGQLQSAAA